MASFAATLTRQLRTAALDRELAAGAKLRGNPLLQRRGERLCSRRRRDRLADEIERLLADAQERPRGVAAAIPFSRAEVRDARIPLSDLACRLRSEAPVDPQGMLLVRRLLSDAGGPVFRPAEPGALRAAVRRVNAALDPRP
jgi:hypothetical protein